MAAGRLDVLMGLDAAEFTAGLTKAEYEAKKFQTRIVQIGSAVGKALGAGLVAAGAGMAYLTKQSIDAADNLNDLSRVTGVTVENLGGIGFAASQAGSDLDGVAQSFGKLNLKISEAARGEKEAAEAFKVLGVAVKDAAGQTRSADAVFTDLATAFASFAEGPEKAALANAVFGKSYASILPLLADGGKALQDNIAYYKAFGGTTTATAQAADAFNDTLGKLELVTGQLGRNLASELLPSLQAVADEVLRASENTGVFSGVAKAAKGTFDFLAITTATFVATLKVAGIALGGFVASLVALAENGTEGFSAVSDAVKEDVDNAFKELDRFAAKLRQTLPGDSLASRIGTANPDRALDRLTRDPLRPAPRLSGPTANKTKQAIDENAQAYARYVEQLADGLAKEEKLSKVQEVTRAIEQNRFGTLIPQQKELLLLLAQQADAADEYGEKIKFNAEIEREQMRVLQERQSVIDRFSSSRKQKDEARQLEILASEIGNDISIIDYDLAKSGFEGITDEIKKTSEAAEELGLIFTSAIGDFIKNPGDGKTFFSALLDDVLQLTTQLLILKPLAEGMTEIFGGTKASSSGGKQIAGFGSMIADFFGDLVGSFAQGTDFVPADGLAMVHRGERIVPAAGNRGNMGTTFNLTQMFAPGTDRETVNQAAAAAAMQLQRSNRRNN